MSNHKLDLLENSVDSLNEALKRYQDGLAGDAKAFKFCVLHLAHFFELILKHYVSLSHPLLIYSDPFAKNLKHDEAHTISVDHAINFLKNEGKPLSPDFQKDLAWLKKLRNAIEHHKFTMNLDEVKETIGRLMSAVHRFDADHKNIDLSQFIDGDNYEVFNQLANTYQLRFEKAITKVHEAERTAYRGLRPKEWNQAGFSVYKCPECSHNTLITNSSSSTGYECTFCANQESDEIEVACEVCDDRWQTGEMSCTDYFGDGRIVCVCPRCSGDPEYLPD